MADFLCHSVQCDTLLTADVLFSCFIGPRAEYQHTTCSTGIKKRIGWLVVFAETIVGKDDKRQLLLQ